MDGSHSTGELETELVLVYVHKLFICDLYYNLLKLLFVVSIHMASIELR